MSPAKDSKATLDLRERAHKRKERTYGIQPKPKATTKDTRKAAKERQPARKAPPARFPLPSLPPTFVPAPGTVQDPGAQSLVPGFATAPSTARGPGRVILPVSLTPPAGGTNTDAALPGHIWHQLSKQAPGLWRVTQSCHPITFNPGPSTFEISIGDVSADPPTRILAVRSENAQPGSPLVFLPVHDMVLAAHKIKLPLDPLSVIERPSQANTRIILPVFFLVLWHPPSVRDIIRYLYIKDDKAFIMMLLPATIAPLPSQHPALAPQDPVALVIRQIATTYTAQAILRHLEHAYGVYVNMCQLGVQERRIWDLLNKCWRVLMRAYALSRGQGGIVLSPAGAPAPEQS